MINNYYVLLFNSINYTRSCMVESRIRGVHEAGEIQLNAQEELHET